MEDQKNLPEEGDIVFVNVKQVTNHGAYVSLEEYGNILVCGDDVKGHLPGQTLISLKENGIDINKRVIKTSGAYPFLICSTQDVEYFRHQVDIIDRIGLKDINKIKDIILDIDSI